MEWFNIYIVCTQGLIPTTWYLTEVKLLLYRYAIALLYNFTLYRITNEILGI